MAQAMGVDAGNQNKPRRGERSGAGSETPRPIVRPSGAFSFAIGPLPTACGVGYGLSPLRGSSIAGSCFQKPLSRFELPRLPSILALMNALPRVTDPALLPIAEKVVVAEPL